MEVSLDIAVETFDLKKRSSQFPTDHLYLEKSSSPEILTTAETSILGHELPGDGDTMLWHFIMTLSMVK